MPRLPCPHLAASCICISCPTAASAQGFGDSSYNCENSTGMCAQTPNLDALALSDSSALFSRFYSAAGVCSPTRAAYDDFDIILTSTSF